MQDFFEGLTDFYRWAADTEVTRLALTDVIVNGGEVGASDRARAQGMLLWMKIGGLLAAMAGLGNCIVGAGSREVPRPASPRSR